METINNNQIPQPAPVSPALVHHWAYFVGALVIILAAAGVIWWQLGLQINDTQGPVTIVTPDADTREMNQINSDIDQVPDTDLDADFQQVDKDLNSL